MAKEVKEEMKTSIVDEFIKEKLSDTKCIKDFPLMISGETKQFDVATNNILYDVNATEEQFNEKVAFLHNVQTQDASGIKFQYRVVKKVDGKFVVAFKSDSFIEKGKVKRNNIKVEV